MWRKADETELNTFTFGFLDFFVVVPLGNPDHTGLFRDILQCSFSLLDQDLSV